MISIEMILPIIPQAQMRARAAIRGGHAFTYKAAKQAQAEESLIALMEKYRPLEPLIGPVKLFIGAYLPIPQSKSNKWKEAAAEGKVMPIIRPDLDNLQKNVLDCMTRLSFWNDDAQVVSIKAVKWYSIRPRWHIILSNYIEEGFGNA